MVKNYEDFGSLAIEMVIYIYIWDGFKASGLSYGLKTNKKTLEILFSGSTYIGKLVGGLEHDWIMTFPEILGKASSQLTNVFQDG